MLVENERKISCASKCEKSGNYYFQCRFIKDEKNIKIKAKEKSKKFGFKHGICQINFAYFLESGRSNGLLKQMHIVET